MVKMTDEKRRAIIESIDNGDTVKKTIEKTGAGQSTICKIRAEMRKDASISEKSVNEKPKNVTEKPQLNLNPVEAVIGAIIPPIVKKSIRTTYGRVKICN